jgi:phage portal protein, HK97 family
MPAGVNIEGRTKEEKLGTLSRIKNAVLSGLRGESSAGGIGVLENGMKFSAMSLPNDQAQFLESRKFSREEIAAMFRIPAYMVGEMANAIKSNIEQQSIEFIKYAIMPWVTKLEQELEYKLLTVEEEYFKFNVNSYMRGTALERAQYLKELRYAGIMTKQEGRVYEDLPIEGKGDFIRSKNEWGKEEYELEIKKREMELGNE